MWSLTSDVRGIRGLLRSLLEELVSVRILLVGFRRDFGDLKTLVKKGMEMTQQDFDVLVAKITEVETVDQSVVTLLDQLSALIKNSANNPALLQQALDRIDAGKASLVAAVTANTPAA